MIDTFVADTSTVDTRLLARRQAPYKSAGDQFAAAASHLGSTRSLFYSGSGRLPNAKQTDDTRRRRNLIGGSGNRHLGQLDLWTEREISRHLRENSEVFEGIIATWACEVIQCGFTLKPKTDDTNLDARVKLALFGWDGDGGWAADCDARGLQHFWELMTTAEETEITDGDHAFWLDPDGNDGAGSVEIIEGDRILTPSGYQAPDGRCMFNGIEVDGVGRPTRVFIADEAPDYCHCSIEHGDLYPVFDKRDPGSGGVLLSVTPKRATATRRQPWLSTAVRGHDEIEDAFVATRIALRNAACYATYTKIADWSQYFEWLQTVDSNFTGLAPENPLEHSPNPGDHHYLNPGEEFGFSQANHPGDQFEPFMKFNLRFVGLPLGMGLEEVIKLFDRNFSASRLTLQGTRRRYTRRQRTIKRTKVSPILSFGIACLQKNGELPQHDKITRLAVRYPTWPYIEPLKDAKADRELRDLKVKSSRTISEERGYDFDQERDELAEEGPLAAAAPVMVPGQIAPEDSEDGDADE